MPRFTDYYSTPEVKDTMNAIVDRFPQIFEGFDPDNINFIITKKKKSDRPIKLHSTRYPMDVFSNGKPYVVEVFDEWWCDMDKKRKNIAVFNIMCAIPREGAGFDASSNQYGKKMKPEISMYLLEYAACGGVPNWIENPSAVDPLERDGGDIVDDFNMLDNDDGITRVPVTSKDIEDV
jgi:hypothetical protein